MTRARIGELLRHLGFKPADLEGRRWKADLGGEGRRYSVSAKLSSTFTHLRVKSIFRLESAPEDSTLLVRLLQLNQEMPVAKFCMDKQYNVHAIMTLPNNAVDDELVNSALSLLSYYVRRCERKLGPLVTGPPRPAERPRDRERVFEVAGSAGRAEGSRATMILRAGSVRSDDNGRRVVLQSNAPRMSEVWTFDVEEKLIGVPAIFTDRVLFSCKDGAIYALSLRDGGPIWHFKCDTSRDQPSSPVGYKRQFFCVVGSQLVAGDVRTGRQHWDAQQTTGAHFSTPTIDAGRVLVGSVDGKLQCFDARAGSLIWAFQCQGPVLSAPVIQDELAYAVASDGHIYVLQLDNGRERARFMIPGGIESVGACAPWIFAGAEGRRLVACDLANRKPMWEVEVGCDVKSPLPPFVDDDRVYFGTTRGVNNRLYVLESATGKSLYEVNTGGWTGTPVGRGDSLLVASDRSLYMIDSGNGTTRACFTASGPISTGLAANDRVFVAGTERGQAVCVALP